MENTMNTRVTLSRLEAGTVHEVNEEFTLPDYLPEIRRVICSGCVVLPESKYIDRGEITTSGLVVYTVYYLGEDGAISSASLNSEYTARIPCQNADLAGISAGDILVRTGAESVGCRATGPRRFMLSCRMRSKAFAAAECDLTERITDAASGENGRGIKNELTLERRKASVECSSVYTAVTTGSVSGEMREREGVRLVSCGGCAVVTDTRLDSDVVTVKGDAYVTCLVMSPDGEYSEAKLKAPFEERLVLGAKQSVQGDRKRSASAVARCASVNLSGGDGGVYTWEMEYDIDATVSEDYTASVTDDVYSTSHETKLTKGEANVVSCLKNASSRLSLSTSKQIPDGDGKRAVHASGRVNTDRIEYTSDGRIVMSGMCSLSVILAGNGEVTTEEVDIPYRYECDAKETDGGVPSISHDATIIATDVRLDGDRMTASAELCINLLALAVSKNAYVEEVAIDKESSVGLRGNLVKIYFPEENESTWDIGKKYHCETRHISQIDGTSSVMIAVE